MDLSSLDKSIVAAPDLIPPSAEGLADRSRHPGEHREEDRGREAQGVSGNEELTPAEERAYDNLVRASTRAAVTLLLTQVVASLVLSNLGGAKITVAKWWILPYLSIQGREELLISTVGWSTLISVAVTCAMALWSLRVRKSEPAISYGWGTGIVMSVILVIFQFIRQWLFPPAASTILLAQAGVIAIGSAILFFGFWPEVESPVPTERNDRPNRTPSGGHPK